MKVYMTGIPHSKNLESIRKTFALFNIPYKEHHNLDYLDNTYTLALCFTTFYPPSAFPPTCKVIYGPHFFVVPDNLNHPLYMHEYDTSRFFFNTLSPWVNTLYREFCNLNLPFINAFFGIDTESIIPVQENANRTHIMIYFKDTFPERLEFAQKYLESKSLPYTIIRYGSYKDCDFKTNLLKTKFVIWIGRHESQGFALEETLASNIPILLWDVETMYEEFTRGKIEYAAYKKKGYKMKATCAPYWSEECGIKFTGQENFEDSFERMMQSYLTFSPRAYVKHNLSITNAWYNLLQSINML